MPVPVPARPAPPLRLPLAGGGEFELAAERPRRFTMVVFYRGWHCPVCRGYLAQLDRRIEELDDLGVSVVAVSGDSEDRAKRSIGEWGLNRLRVVYGQDLTSMRAWGLFVSKGIKDPEPELFGEPGVFLIRPDGTIHGGTQLHASRPPAHRGPGAGHPVLHRARLPAPGRGLTAPCADCPTFELAG